MKANASLYLDPRAKKNGFCTVKIKVTYNRERRYYSTDVDLYYPKVEPNIPDPLTKLLTAIRKTPEQKSILSKLDYYQKKADNTIELLSVFTFEKFEDLFFENRNIKESVSYAFEKRIEDLRLNNRIGSAVSYECTKNSLEAFKSKLTFAQITPEFLRKYEAQMLKEGKSYTTIGIYLRTLRALYNLQGIDKSLYPFGKGKYEIPKSRNIKKALTLEDIGRIYNYEAQPESYEDRAKDYWIFLYLCNGMNVKDFCLLKWSNLDGDLLTYERAKTSTTERTKTPIKVPLKAEALAVIKKWGQPSVSKNAFIFPHISKEMSAERQREVYQQLTQNINKHMKQIAKKVAINKPVTTYYARHSFATILKRSGVNISMIGDLLGHSSLATTQNYLAGFEIDKIQEQTDVLTKAFHKVV